MLIVLGVILLIGLVIMHELGHYYAARKADVEVEEFGIGFPPKAKTIGKKNGTEYTLNWLPLGGFVKLKGEYDADTEKGSYGAAKLSDKIKIMLAGITVNAVIAVILLTVVALAGLPKVLDNQFTVSGDQTYVQDDVIAAVVAEDSPAYQAGIKAGDTLISIKEVGDCGEQCKFHEFNDANNLGEITKNMSGKQVEIKYSPRNEDTILTAQLTLNNQSVIDESKIVNANCKNSGGDDCPVVKGYLGIVPSDYEELKYTWSAPIVAVVVSGQIVQETFVQFGNIISDLFKGDTSSASEQVYGVVGIGYILGQLSAQGLISVIIFIAVISLSLAIMNLLPIPALDGGRLFVTLLYRAMNKPLTKNVEDRIHGTGFAALMVLFLLITIVDVQRFIL